MTRCCVCGSGCVPMADYQWPVCIDCDSRNDAIWLALLAKPRHATRRAPRTWQLPEWAAQLPLSHKTGPGDPADIAQLLNDMDRGPRAA